MPAITRLTRALLAIVVAIATLLPTAVGADFLTPAEETTETYARGEMMKQCAAEDPAPEPIEILAQSNGDSGDNPLQNGGGAGTNPGTDVVPTAAPSPGPSASKIPLAAPLQGPGMLQAPSPVPSSSPVTPPPIPTPTPTASPANGPIYLTRDTPTPAASGSPSSGGSPATGSSPAPAGSSAAGGSTAPGASGSPPAGSSPASAGAPAGSGARPAASASAPLPAGSPSASPKPIPTLGPNQVAILADEVSGSTKNGIPGDATGNVHVFYSEGVMVGDAAHYDGDHTITVTGHASISNRDADTVLHARSIVFDLASRRAVLIDGRGQSTRGVEKGNVYFTAEKLSTNSRGVSHGDHATFTTCENPRAGYHVASKSIDVYPGDKLVAHNSVVFLGALAIFYLPVMIIPLRNVPPGRRAAGFIPEIGYSQVEGVYVRARIGFGNDDYYYGYYRVEEYSREGLGLGYVAFIGRRDHRRGVAINAYTFDNRAGGGRQNNLDVLDNENYSDRTRGQFDVNYTGDYGPLVSLPASYRYSGTVTHVTPKTQETYTFSKFDTGSQSSQVSGNFAETDQMAQGLTQQYALSYSKDTNSFVGSVSQSSIFHINTLTTLTTPGADYNLQIDRYDTQSPSSVDRLPELQIHPHFRLGMLPFTSQFTVGEYSEPQTPLDTQRFQGLFGIGPVLLRILKFNELSAGVNVQQDYYGTGDLKAQVSQTASLTSTIGRHMINSITYNEQNTNGPAALPFRTLDILGGNSHGATESMRFFNGGVYTFTLATQTDFNREAQPVSYELETHPSARSTLNIGGSYNPGPGNGFYQSNVAIATPFGRDQDLQFTTIVDWKNKARLESKNIYFKKIVGNCYDVRASYNQDLKTLSFTVDLLAFPSHSAAFGFNSQSSIVPQSFAY